jgi:hypothetical protein
MRTLRVGAVGGLIGGVAEIAWIAVYGVATATPVAPVARGIVATFAPWLSTTPWTIPLALAIHLALAAGLGVALAIALRLMSQRATGGLFEFATPLIALAGVWVINFLVLLPKVNPGFTHLLPFEVTLISKLLFGLSTAVVFREQSLRLKDVRIR